MWSGERLTRKQLTSRPDYLWPELWKSMGKHAKLKEKQKWSNEKLHLDNARKLRGIYFIDPEDKEFEETIKNARKKLETSVAPALPCKMFFLAENMSKVNQIKRKRTPGHSRMPSLTCHLVHRKDRTIGTAGCEVEERHGESLRGCAGQQLFPPSEP